MAGRYEYTALFDKSDLAQRQNFLLTVFTRNQRPSALHSEQPQNSGSIKKLPSSEASSDATFLIMVFIRKLVNFYLLSLISDARLF